MGIKCRIKKEDGVIKQVLAPNGRNSILFNNISNFIENKNKALDVWTIAYTPQFKESFGDWEANNHNALDENGEPFSEDVLRFTSNSSIIDTPLTKKDIITLRNSLINTNIGSIENLFNRLSNAFYINGMFRFSIDNAKNSGVYSTDEINYMNSDAFNVNAFQSFIDKFRAYYLRNNGRSSDLDNISLNEAINPDLVVYRDSYNELGKRELENPYVVEQNIIDTIGGIRDRALFDEQFSHVRYNALTERFQNDTDFADRIYNSYSYLTRMPIVSSSDATTAVSGRTLAIDNNNPMVFDLTPDKVGAFRKKLDVLLQVPTNMWESKKSLVVASLKELEEDAIDMNMDIIGLSNQYDNKTQEQIENFLTSLDVFLSDASRGEVTSEFNDAYATLFSISNEPRQTAVALPARMRNYSLVYMPNNYKSEASLFEEDSVLKVNDNVYHKIDNSISLQDLYEGLYSIATLNSDILPRRMYYPVAFDKNGFNKDKLNNPSNKSKVLDAFKRYITSIMPYYPVSPSIENMLVYKAMFGHNMYPSTPSINKDDFSNRFYNIKGSSYETMYIFPNKFRQYVLREKLNRTDLYTNVLSKFKVDGTEIVLLENDYLSKQDINMLLPRGSMRTGLINYSLLSTNPTINDIFSIKDRNYYPIAKDMNAAMYATYPGLLEPFTGQVSYDRNNPNRIVAKNVFDYYINIHNNAYEKVAQDGQNSIYEALPQVHNGFISISTNTLNAAETLNTYEQFESKDGSYVRESKLYKNTEIDKYQC